jgi:hypothetical protein
MREHPAAAARFDSGLGLGYAKPQPQNSRVFLVLFLQKKNRFPCLKPRP